MTESASQGPNNSNDDDDKKNRPALAAGSKAQDVSGTFALAQNPDQFFQGSIDVNSEDVGTASPKAFSGPAPAPTAGAPPTGTPASASAQNQTMPGPASAMVNPEPTIAQNSVPAPGAKPAAAQTPADFFNQANRPQAAQNSQPANQAAPQTSQTGPVPGYSFSNFLNPASQQPSQQDPGRVPSGFFDRSQGPGTAPGALEQSPAQPQPRQQAGYTGGLTAEQAFFFDGSVPEQVQQPQPGSQEAFNSFYETQGQQPDPAHQGQSVHPQSANRDNRNPSNRNPSAQSPDNQATQPGGFTQDPSGQANYQYYEQNSATPNTGINIVTGSSNQTDEAATATAPVHKKKKKKRRPPPEETSEDFTKAGQEISRFERLMTPENKGLILFTIFQARQVIMAPEKFFKSLPQHGNVAEPALFLCLLAAVSGLLAGVINFNLIITIQFFLGSVIQAWALSYVVWKLSTGMGSAERFESNFRVIAYSQAALIIAALKFTFLGNPIPGYITLFISTVFQLRFQIIGLRQLHDQLTPGKIFVILILPTFLIMFIRYKLLLL